MDPARIVFVGDLHLGRRPSALPDRDALGSYGLSASQLGPAEVWRRTVDLALDRGAHAVVLAGDVVDRPDDRFEAGRVLEVGIQRLTEAGISVHAVVGNHDVDALPRVARMIPGFELIGAGGTWQVVRLEREGVVPCQLAGWSFPTRRVEESPLRDFDRRALEDGVAALGVLHCDLDASVGGYAPVRLSELERTGLDGWLLGHVHKPAELSARPLGYLGSMVGLDAGEPGARGPWWVEVEGPGRISAQHVPLSPTRYETVDCALAGLRDGERADVADDLHARIDAALDALHARLEADDGVGRARARVVIVRVRARGKERHVGSIRRVLFDSSLRAARSIDQTLYVVEKVVEDATPDLDLDALVERADAPGLLARRLVELRDGSPRARALIEKARLAFEAASSEARFGQLDAAIGLGERESDAAQESIADVLLRAGTRELEGLLGQERSALAAAGEATP